MTDIFANCALLNQTILYLPPNKQIKARLASGFDIDIFSYKAKWTIKFENIRGDPDYSIAYLDPSIKEEKHQYTIESMG